MVVQAPENCLASGRQSVTKSGVPTFEIVALVFSVSVRKRTLVGLTRVANSHSSWLRNASAGSLSVKFNLLPHSPLERSSRDNYNGNKTSLGNRTAQTHNVLKRTMQGSILLNQSDPILPCSHRSVSAEIQSH